MLTLVLVALASLILGMGLPVTASYIVLATLAAPALYDLISQTAMLDALSAPDLPSNVQAVVNLFGGDPMRALTEMPAEMRQLVRGELLDPALVTGMLLSAHLIIFWLSQDSNVTPPVCLVAFTAAAIAAWAGEKDRAMDRLREAIRRGRPFEWPEVHPHADPMLAPLANHPAFLELIEGRG